MANTSNQDYSILEKDYLDVPTVIDYLVFLLMIIIPYELNSTWNNDWDSSEKILPKTLRLKWDNEVISCLIIYAHHKQDIINRYKQLRYKQLQGNVLSANNINSLFKKWFNSIGTTAYTNSNELWQNIGVDYRINVSLTDITNVINKRIKSVNNYWGL